MVMSQSSLFNAGETPETGHRAQVLVPYPLSRAYDYLVPQNMTVSAGDYVRVPLGKRDTIGVVWTTDASDDKVDPAKLKSVLQKFTFDPMPQVHRQFVEWVARYTMSDVGSVLKMSLSAPEALQPPKSVPVFTLTDNIPVKLPASRQKIIDLLKDGVPRRAVDIAREAGCSAAVVRSMAAAGQLETLAGTPRAPCSMVDVTQNRLSFSDHQKTAADALQKLAAAHQYAAVLLDGVTGSGKTEVYFEAIAEALRQGKQALILLPEISLSAQFLERFERRFGVLPALWHSEVPTAQRRVTWTGVAEGKTKVVVGARSALFLPFADLGLIVVDEEHDASYKQEEGVLYNARDMAIVRARLGSFPVVLVSATPSLETMVNVQQNKYTYLNLPSRHAGARLPDINVINLKSTPPERQKFIAPPLQKALQEVFEAKEQSLLFLNRRGYAPLTLCRTCGHRFQCPSCAAWLVEHKRHSRLQCHHCGFSQQVPRNCPSCQAEDSFAACGPGQ